MPEFSYESPAITEVAASIVVGLWAIGVGAVASSASSD